MTSPTRSVVVRLAMDPSSYVAGAAKAERSTLALDAATSKVGPHAATSMEQAAAGAGKAEGALGKLNKSAGALGFTLGGLAGVGGAVAVGMSVKWAADYQTALTKLVTTAGEAPKNISAVSKGMLDMAGQVGISAQKLAQGMYTIDSSGFHGSDSLLVLKASAQGAAQEGADLGKVVNATTTILHDYHLKASDAATVTSQLVTAVSHGKVSFDELTGALDSITPLASKAGISIADVTGTLAAMTASGMTADQATQNMQNTLMHLASPTSTMIAELAQLGVSTDDLASSLSTKGLAGTLQMVETAIVSHVDPATQRVLLPALNKSKTAAQDLQIMIGQMPPALAKLSKGFLDGSVNITAYTKGAKGFGGPAGAMGTQFLSLVKSSQGFNNVLKQGGPAAQVVTAAMAKSFGTTSALNVALQTTGDNAAATNAAIADIGNAGADSKGNIKGWAEVQATFNQQLAETEQKIQSLVIEAGQHLLPVLTDVTHWVGSTGVPGIASLASGVGGLVHDFEQLPAPVKDAAYALLGLRIADHIGLLDKLSAGTGKVTGAFRSMATDMSTAFAEAKANQVRLATESAALWTASEAQQAQMKAASTGLWATAATEVETASTSMSRSTGNMAGLGAAAGAAAKGGLGALKSAAGGLMDMFGGPWGVALTGAVALLPPFLKFLQGTPSVAEKAASSVKAIADAIDATNGAMDESVRRSIAIQLRQDGLFDAASRWGLSTKDLVDAVSGVPGAMQKVATAAAGYKAALDRNKDAVGNLGGAEDEAKKKSDDYLAALSKLSGGVSDQEQKQKDLAAAVKGTAAASMSLGDAVKKSGATVATVWDANTVVLDHATASQIAALGKLGFEVTHLPKGQVVVTADTGQAINTVDTLLTHLAQLRNKTVTVTTVTAGDHISSSTGPGGTQLKAGGGYISGAGTGTSDSIDAKLSNGEFVVKAAQTAKHRPLLQAINSGSIPGFANGGVVGGAPLRSNIGLAASNVGYSLTGYLGSSFVPALTGSATAVVAGINSVQAKALAAEKSGAAARLAAAEAANARATAAAAHRSRAHRAAVARDNAARLAAVNAYNKQALDASTAFSKSLAAADKPLTDMANRRQAVADRLKTAQANLAAAIKVRDDFATQVAQSARQYTDLTQVQATRGLPLSTNAIVTDLRTRLAAITTFRANLATLAQDGLSKTAYDQIVAAGVSGGSATAAALAAGGQTAIAQVNSVEGQIDSASKDLGTEAAKTMYQAGVNVAQGLVNGLNGQNAALTAAAKHLADTLTSEVKKALGIHSPSLVFHEIGGHIGQGMVNGISSMRPAVAAEMRALADTRALTGLTTRAVAAPVRTREMVAAGGGGAPAAIDYRQLAAAVAAAIPDRPTVHVDRWDSTTGQTPYENAEALAFISRTRN